MLNFILRLFRSGDRAVDRVEAELLGLAGDVRELRARFREEAGLTPLEPAGGAEPLPPPLAARGALPPPPDPDPQGPAANGHGRRGRRN